jgi:hypothetical protein
MVRMFGSTSITVSPCGFFSPPSLVVATTILLAALLIGLDQRSSRALRVALSAALLGATQISLMEYDTDVPQFSEVLYLPLLLVTSLGSPG